MPGKDDIEALKEQCQLYLAEDFEIGSANLNEAKSKASAYVTALIQTLGEQGQIVKSRLVEIQTLQNEYAKSQRAILDLLGRQKDRTKPTYVLLALMYKIAQAELAMQERESFHSAYDDTDAGNRASDASFATAEGSEYGGADTAGTITSALPQETQQLIDSLSDLLVDPSLQQILVKIEKGSSLNKDESEKLINVLTTSLTTLKSSEDAINQEDDINRQRITIQTILSKLQHNRPLDDKEREKITSILRTAIAALQHSHYPLNKDIALAHNKVLQKAAKYCKGLIQGIQRKLQEQMTGELTEGVPSAADIETTTNPLQESINNFLDIVTKLLDGKYNAEEKQQALQYLKELLDYIMPPAQDGNRKFNTEIDSEIQKQLLTLYAVALKIEDVKHQDFKVITDKVIAVNLLLKRYFDMVLLYSSKELLSKDRMSSYLNDIYDAILLVTSYRTQLPEELQKEFATLKDNLIQLKGLRSAFTSMAKLERKMERIAKSIDKLLKKKPTEEKEIIDQQGKINRLLGELIAVLQHINKIYPLDPFTTEVLSIINNPNKLSAQEFITSIDKFLLDNSANLDNHTYGKELLTSLAAIKLIYIARLLSEIQEPARLRAPSSSVTPELDPNRSSSATAQDIRSEDDETASLASPYYSPLSALWRGMSSAAQTVKAVFKSGEAKREEEKEETPVASIPKSIINTDRAYKLEHNVQVLVALLDLSPDKGAVSDKDRRQIIELIFRANEAIQNYRLGDHETKLEDGIEHYSDATNEWLEELLDCNQEVAQYLIKYQRQKDGITDAEIPADLALFVVDPEVGFDGTTGITEELGIPGARENVPHINRLVGLFSDRPVIVSRDVHPSAEEHSAWEKSNRALIGATFTKKDLHSHPDAGGHYWCAHCRKDTKGSNYTAGLILPPNMIPIAKGTTPEEHQFGALYGRRSKSLGGIEALRAAGVTTLVVTGWATDYCVRDTIRQALAAGLNVIITLEACRAIDPKFNPKDGIYPSKEEILRLLLTKKDDAADWTIEQWRQDMLQQAGLKGLLGEGIGHLEVINEAKPTEILSAKARIAAKAVEQKQNTIITISDIEGRFELLQKQVEGSNGRMRFAYDKDGNMYIKFANPKDIQLVINGDMFDHGPDAIYLWQIIANTIEVYAKTNPDIIRILLGNRELNKVRFAQELNIAHILKEYKRSRESKTQQDALPYWAGGDKFYAWLKKENPDFVAILDAETPESVKTNTGYVQALEVYYLKWMLANTMGSGKSPFFESDFEYRRFELMLRKQLGNVLRLTPDKLAEAKINLMLETFGLTEIQKPDGEKINAWILLGLKANNLADQKVMLMLVKKHGLENFIAKFNQSLEVATDEINKLKGEIPGLISKYFDLDQNYVLDGIAKYEGAYKVSDYEVYKSFQKAAGVKVSGVQHPAFYAEALQQGSLVYINNGQIWFHGGINTASFQVPHFKTDGTLAFIDFKALIEAETTPAGKQKQLAAWAAALNAAYKYALAHQDNEDCQDFLMSLSIENSFSKKPGNQFDEKSAIIAVLMKPDGSLNPTVEDAFKTLGDCGITTVNVGHKPYGSSPIAISITIAGRKLNVTDTTYGGGSACYLVTEKDGTTYKVLLDKRFSKEPLKITSDYPQMRMQFDADRLILEARVGANPNVMIWNCELLLMVLALIVPDPKKDTLKEDVLKGYRDKLQQFFYPDPNKETISEQEARDIINKVNEIMKDRPINASNAIELNAKTGTAPFQILQFRTDTAGFKANGFGLPNGVLAQMVKDGILVDAETADAPDIQVPATASVTNLTSIIYAIMEDLFKDKEQNAAVIQGMQSKFAKVDFGSSSIPNQLILLKMMQGVLLNAQNPQNYTELLGKIFNYQAQLVNQFTSDIKESLRGYNATNFMTYFVSRANLDPNFIKQERDKLLAQAKDLLSKLQEIIANMPEPLPEGSPYALLKEKIEKLQGMLDTYATTPEKQIKTAVDFITKELLGQFNEPLKLIGKAILAANKLNELLPIAQQDTGVEASTEDPNSYDGVINRLLTELGKEHPQFTVISSIATDNVDKDFSNPAVKLKILEQISAVINPLPKDAVKNNCLYIILEQQRRAIDQIVSDRQTSIKQAQSWVNTRFQRNFKPDQATSSLTTLDKARNELLDVLRGLVANDEIKPLEKLTVRQSVSPQEEYVLLKTLLAMYDAIMQPNDDARNPEERIKALQELKDSMAVVNRHLAKEFIAAMQFVIDAQILAINLQKRIDAANTPRTPSRMPTMQGMAGTVAGMMSTMQGMASKVRGATGSVSTRMGRGTSASTSGDEASPPDTSDTKQKTTTHMPTIGGMAASVGGAMRAMASRMPTRKKEPATRSTAQAAPGTANPLFNPNTAKGSGGFFGFRGFTRGRKKDESTAKSAETEPTSATVTPEENDDAESTSSTSGLDFKDPTTPSKMPTLSGMAGTAKKAAGNAYAAAGKTRKELTATASSALASMASAAAAAMPSKKGKAKTTLEKLHDAFTEVCSRPQYKDGADNPRYVVTDIETSSFAVQRANPNTELDEAKDMIQVQTKTDQGNEHIAVDGSVEAWTIALLALKQYGANQTINNISMGKEVAGELSPAVKAANFVTALAVVSEDPQMKATLQRTGLPLTANATNFVLDVLSTDTTDKEKTRVRDLFGITLVANGTLIQTVPNAQSMTTTSTMLTTAFKGKKPAGLTTTISPQALETWKKRPSPPPPKDDGRGPNRSSIDV